MDEPRVLYRLRVRRIRRRHQVHLHVRTVGRLEFRQPQHALPVGQLVNRRQAFGLVRVAVEVSSRQHHRLSGIRRRALARRSGEPFADRLIDKQPLRPERVPRAHAGNHGYHNSNFLAHFSFLLGSRAETLCVSFAARLSGTFAPASAQSDDLSSKRVQIFSRRTREFVVRSGLPMNSIETGPRTPPRHGAQRPERSEGFLPPLRPLCPLR